MTRPADSAYDRDWAAMSTRLLHALARPGRTIDSYVTGIVMVDGHTPTGEPRNAGPGHFGGNPSP